MWFWLKIECWYSKNRKETTLKRGVKSGKLLNKRDELKKLTICDLSKRLEFGCALELTWISRNETEAAASSTHCSKLSTSLRQFKASNERWRSKEKRESESRNFLWLRMTCRWQCLVLMFHVFFVFWRIGFFFRRCKFNRIERNEIPGQNTPKTDYQKEKKS